MRVFDTIKKGNIMKNFKYSLMALMVSVCVAEGAYSMDESDAWLKQSQSAQSAIPNFQEGVYTVKKLGWDAGPCGSLQLENKNGAIRLSQFHINDGDYQKRLKQDMLNKDEEIKKFGAKAAYSIPFGEKQIG